MSKKVTQSHVALGPVGLDIYTKWQAVLERRGQWREEHKELVVMAASEYELYCTACQELRESGYTVTFKNGALGKSPWIGIRQTALSNVESFTNKFGLNLLFQEKVASGEEDEESEI